jgi:hypothetical protein
MTNNVDLLIVLTWVFCWVLAITAASLNRRGRTVRNAMPYIVVLFFALVVSDWGRPVDILGFIAVLSVFTWILVFLNRKREDDARATKDKEA